MKITELKNEQALEALGDMIEPATEIMSDEDIANTFRKGGKPIVAISKILKRHPKACVQILAASEGVPYEEYSCSLFQMPIKLLELINEPEVRDFLSWQANNQDLSGFALENTEDQQSTSENTSLQKEKKKTND